MVRALTNSFGRGRLQSPKDQSSGWGKKHQSETPMIERFQETTLKRVEGSGLTVTSEEMALPRTERLMTVTVPALEGVPNLTSSLSIQAQKEESEVKRVRGALTG